MCYVARLIAWLLFAIDKATYMDDLQTGGFAMTAEQLREKLKNELEIVERYLEVERRNNVSGKADAQRAESAAQNQNGACLRAANRMGRLERQWPELSENVQKPTACAMLINRCASLAIKLRTDIATVLRRLERRSREVKPGAGRRPTRYATISL